MVQAGLGKHSRVWKAGCSGRCHCQVQPACKWRRYCSVVNGTSCSASVCTFMSLIALTSLQDWHLRPLARSFIPVFHYLLVLAQRLCLSLLYRSTTAYMSHTHSIVSHRLTTQNSIHCNIFVNTVHTSMYQVPTLENSTY